MSTVATQTIQQVLSSNHPQLTNADASALGDYSDRQTAARSAAEIEAKKTFVAEYLRRMEAPAFPQFENAGQFLNFVMGQGVNRLMLEEERAFVLDGQNLEVFQQVAGYFVRDRATFGCSLDFNKGLLMFGAYGVGKSFMMRLFASNPRQSYRVVSSRHIAEDFRLNGNICQYQSAFLNDCSGKFFGQREIGLCIDELGAENDRVANFGNRSNVVAELLQDRYENRQLRGTMTHAVTNQQPHELRDAYGPRVYDRLKQLFNIVEFPDDATSRRS